MTIVDGAVRTVVVGGVFAVVDGAVRTVVVGGVLTAVVGAVRTVVVGGAFFTAVVGGVFLTAVVGGVPLTAVTGGVFLTAVVGGDFLTVDVGDFLGVVVGVVDEALAAFGTIPAKPNDNASMAVIFFTSVLLFRGYKQWLCYQNRLKT